MRLYNLDSELKLMHLLENDAKLKVTVKDGNLGCSDVQDVCYEEGYAILYKKGVNFYIDRVSDGENILCVDDANYIAEIIDSFEEV